MKKYLFITLYSLLIFISCKTDKTSGLDNTLDIRMAKEPEKLNAIMFPNPVASEVYQYIFLPLAEVDPTTMKLAPVMIKSIPNAEDVLSGPYKGGSQFTFEILDEAKWDDGKPVTGDDYLFTLKAIMHPGTSAGAYRGVVTNFSDVILDPSNKKKVTVVYKKYYMLAQEAVLNIEVLPKHIYDPSGIMDRVKFTDLKDEKAAEALVAKDSLLSKFANGINGVKYSKEIVSGSGPYKLSKWNAGQQIVLEKKSNYWGVGPNAPKSISTEQHADKIIMHIIPDETAAITRMKNNEIDLLSGLNTTNFESLQKNSANAFQYQTAQLMKYYNVLINHNDVILKSKSVRKALAYTTNVDAFIKTFENGNATRLVGPIHPTKRFYNKNIVPYAFDISAAKKQLNDDGWMDTNNNGIVDKKINGKIKELTLPLFVSGDLGSNIALMMQADAKQAGIDLQITKKEFAQIRKENIDKGKYSLVLQVSSPDLGYDDLYSKMHSDNAEIGESNTSGYKNKEVDALITNINNVKDDNEREKLFLKLQEVLHDDLPLIFLYSPKEKFVVSKHWKGSTNVKRPGYQANTFLAQ